MPHLRLGRQNERLHVVLVIACTLREHSCLIADGGKLCGMEWEGHVTLLTGRKRQQSGSSEAERRHGGVASLAGKCSVTYIVPSGIDAA
jgi:hypothetical protein